MLNTKLISIIVAVTVLAALGGYIFWRANQPSIPAGPPSGVDTSASSTSLTADWQTYRNEEYGFEVKYPEDWFNITLENAAGSRSFVEFSNKERTSTGSGVIVVQVAIGSDPNLFNALRNTRADETTEKNLIFYTKIRDETVAGNPAVRYIADYKNVPAGVLPTGEEVLMRRDGAVVYFRIYGYSPLIVKFNQNVFNQILSTFKFISSTGSTSLQQVSSGQGGPVDVFKKTIYLVAKDGKFYLLLDNYLYERGSFYFDFKSLNADEVGQLSKTPIVVEVDGGATIFSIFDMAVSSDKRLILFTLRTHMSEDDWGTFFTYAYDNERKYLQLLFSSIESEEFDSPVIRAVSRDSSYVAFKLRACNGCDAGPFETLVYDINRKTRKNIGPEVDFRWLENGNFEYKKCEVVAIEAGFTSCGNSSSTTFWTQGIW